MTRHTAEATLQALTAPRTVALIGASNDETRLTARPLVFLRQHGFAGTIYPVNPVRETVQGIKAYRSVTDIPEPVDLAYILVDAEPAMIALRECAAAGVKVVCILADGFAEAGEAGRARQKEMTRLVHEAGILLIGPNSTGLVDTRSGLSCTTNAAFRADELGKGRFAVLSQSGSVIGTVLSRGRARGLDYAMFISVGNEAGAGIGDIGQILLNDPEIDGFLLFLETIRDRTALATFARRAASQGKPVVAYMIGKSDEGQALAVTHTGALTGSGDAVNSFLKSIGVKRVEMFEALLEAPAALVKAKLRAARPRTVTVVSTTGGGGAMVVDQISAHGVAIAGCSAAARATLEAQDIPLGQGKLVDVTLAGTRYETMKSVVSTLIEDRETGLLVIAIGSSAQFNPELAVKPIVDAVSEAFSLAAPVVAFPLPHAEDSMKILEAGGIASFRTVESCAETIALLMHDDGPAEEVAVNLPEEAAALVAASSSGILDEVEAGAVFAALGAGRPSQVVLQPGQAAPASLPFAFPVVVKLVSADLPHKSEAGAIRVGVGDHKALDQAVTDMKASAANHAPGYKLSGILIQEMCKGLGEALIGVTRDPLAGPIVTVGMGGVMTEIYRDTSVRPAPVSVEQARQMIAEVKGFELFRGFRGRPLGDLEALAQMVHAVSMIAAIADVEEAEINPVLVGATGEGVVLLDALIRRR